MTDMNHRNPTIAHGFGLLVLLIFSTFLFGFIVDLLFDSSAMSFLSKTTAGLLSETISYILAFSTVIAISLSRRKKSMTNNESALKFAKISPYLLLLLIIITPFLGIVIEPLAFFIPMPESLERLLEITFKEIIQPNILSFVTIGILPAVFEELLFRGIILEGMLDSYKPATAIFWSSFLFGIMHLNPPQFVAGLISGIFIGWIYWRTRSLIPGMVIHATNNILGYFLMLRFGMKASWEIIGFPLFITLFIVSAIVFAIGSVKLSRAMPQVAKSNVATGQEMI